MRTSVWTTPNWTSGTSYVRPHMSFTMRHEILFTPARTQLLQGQKWGFWIPKLLLFLVQHYDQNIQEKCLHPCESQCLSIFFWVNFMMYPKWWWFTARSNQIWLEAEYEGKFLWTHLLFFGATYLNRRKRFGDFLNFWSKSNERKSPKKKILRLLILSLVPNV